MTENSYLRHIDLPAGVNSEISEDISKQLTLANEVKKKLVVTFPQNSLFSLTAGFLDPSFVNSLIDAAQASAKAISTTYAEQLEQTLNITSKVLMDNAGGWQTAVAALSKTIASSFRSDIFVNGLNSFLPKIKPMHIELPAGLDCGLDEGVAFTSAVRDSISERIIDAGTLQERRKVLGRFLMPIAKDCYLFARSHIDAEGNQVGYFLAEAASAAINGHIAPAQALLANLLDTLIRIEVPKDLSDLATGRHEKKKLTPSERKEELSDKSLTAYLALRPLASVYQIFYVEDGGSVPRTFSRHASAHRVSRQQYSKRNTAQALLCVTALAEYLYGWGMD